MDEEGPAAAVWGSAAGSSWQRQSNVSSRRSVHVAGSAALLILCRSSLIQSQSGSRDLQMVSMGVCE
jgi:hypothetical protein